MGLYRPFNRLQPTQILFRRYSISSEAKSLLFSLFFFFNDTATTEIYTLSLHDALPISARPASTTRPPGASSFGPERRRSEEHTSELQSHSDLVCRLLLEKKNTKRFFTTRSTTQEARALSDHTDNQS